MKMRKVLKFLVGVPVIAIVLYIGYCLSLDILKEYGLLHRKYAFADEDDDFDDFDDDYFEDQDIAGEYDNEK